MNVNIEVSISVYCQTIAVIFCSGWRSWVLNCLLKYRHDKAHQKPFLWSVFQFQWPWSSINSTILFAQEHECRSRSAAVQLLLKVSHVTHVSSDHSASQMPHSCDWYWVHSYSLEFSWTSNGRAYRRPLWLDKLSVVLRVTEFLSFCVCMCMYPHKTREDCVASSDGTFCHCLLVIGRFEGGLLWEQVSRSWLFEKCVWVLCLHV